MSTKRFSKILKLAGYKYNPGYKRYELIKDEKEIDAIGIPIIQSDVDSVVKFRMKNKYNDNN